MNCHVRRMYAHDDWMQLLDEAMQPAVEKDSCGRDSTVFENSTQGFCKAEQI
jgi:hypothetical protein